MPVVKDKTKSKSKAKDKAQIKQKAKAKAKASAKVVSNIQNKIIIGEMPKKRKASTAKGRKTTKSTPQEQYRQPITNVFQPQVASFQPPTPFVNNTTRLLEQQPNFNLLTERVNRLEAASLVRPTAKETPVLVPLRYAEAEPEVIMYEEPIIERDIPVINPEKEDLSLQVNYKDQPIKRSKDESPVINPISSYFQKKQTNTLIPQEEIPVSNERAASLQEKTKHKNLIDDESEYENIINTEQMENTYLDRLRANKDDNNFGYTELPSEEFEITPIKKQRQPKKAKETNEEYNDLQKQIQKNKNNYNTYFNKNKNSINKGEGSNLDAIDRANKWYNELAISRKNLLNWIRINKPNDAQSFENKMLKQMSKEQKQLEELQKIKRL